MAKNYVRKHPKNRTRGIIKHAADTKETAIAVDRFNGRTYGPDQEDEFCPSRVPTLEESTTAEAMAIRAGITFVDDDISFDEVMEATVDGKVNWKAIGDRVNANPELKARGKAMVAEILEIGFDQWVENRKET